MSKRDIKVTVIGLAVICLLLSPVYFVLRDRSDAYNCKRNFQSMSKAISLYAAENNDRLPPAFVTMDGKTPLVENDGGIYSWAYLVHPYMRAGTTFRCPKATDEECYWDHDSQTGKLMAVSYGMYLPMGGLSLSDVPNPEEAILITETNSLAANDTFDPHPILGSDGKAVRDGFIVTWDTGNEFSTSKISSVTRLAFPNTKDGTFHKDGSSKHPDGNHFLTVSGTALSLPPIAAKVEWDAKRGKILGRWAIPENYSIGAPHQQ